jgi:hypothetical protein
LGVSLQGVTENSSQILWVGSGREKFGKIDDDFANSRKSAVKRTERRNATY